MGTQFNPCSEANCSSMKVLFFVALCLSNASVFGYHGSGSGMGSGMPGECCPLKAIMGNPDPSKNGLYMFAGYADRALPWECEGSPCLYTMAGYGGQKYCMAPSAESEVMCIWEHDEWIWEHDEWIWEHDEWIWQYDEWIWEHDEWIWKWRECWEETLLKM